MLKLFKKTKNFSIKYKQSSCEVSRAIKDQKKQKYLMIGRYIFSKIKINFLSGFETFLLQFGEHL